MKQHQLSATECVWYLPEQVAEPLPTLFDPNYWQQQQRVVGSAQGRGTTWFIQMQHQLAALRHYYRGGLFGKLVKDKYWFTGWENTRGYQECALLQYLHQQGVHVPQPIAARAVKTGLFYQADLLSGKIDDAQDVVSLLCQRRFTRVEYQAIGAEIKKMHSALVNHTDLNIHNILLDGAGKVWLIDFDKCQRQPQAGTWQQNNLARLKRSFLKEQKKRNIHWQLVEFDYLLEGYNMPAGEA